MRKFLAMMLILVMTGFPALAQTAVQFDHDWTGVVELQLRSILVTGLAGIDGANGQAVVDQLNAMGGIYAGAVFQPHHNGIGFPTYGFHWFYVSYLPEHVYQIVEFGPPPAGDVVLPPGPVTGPPVVIPVCPDPTPLLTAIQEQNERIFADSNAQRTALGAQIKAVDDHITAIDNNPSWLRKVVTSPLFAPIAAGIGTWATCQISRKC